jgi:hypothetical protein
MRAGVVVNGEPISLAYVMRIGQDGLIKLWY